MKITHRHPAPPWFAVPPSATVDPAYEAEVRASTERSEAEYQRRALRLERAEARLAQARKTGTTRKRLASLQRVMEQRRAELDAYRRLMTRSPASAQHRGTRSYRPVPPVHGNPIP